MTLGHALILQSQGLSSVDILSALELRWLPVQFHLGYATLRLSIRQIFDVAQIVAFSRT